MGYGTRGYRMLRWVRGVIDKYPEATVLILIHNGLQPNGRFSGQAKELFEKVAPDYPHVRLMLSGHEDGSLQRTDWFDDDGDGTPERSFTTMMFNVQDDRKNGLGFLRILTFYPGDRRIEVKTYSPWFDKWGYFDDKPEKDAFTLENAF
jgi:hypothetical protein